MREQASLPPVPHSRFPITRPATPMRKLTVEEMHRLDVEAFRQAEKVPLTVVLDNVRSMHNVGSVLRTADAFRLERVVLCGITPCPPHPDIHKTALGAEDSVAWTHEASTLEAVRSLVREGVTVLAAEQVSGSTPLQAWRAVPGARYALVMGHEVRGVAQDVVDACHGALEIPQIGTKHSLNVSVSAGILLWEMFRQLRFGPRP